MAPARVEQLLSQLDTDAEGLKAAFLEDLKLDQHIIEFLQDVRRDITTCVRCLSDMKTAISEKNKPGYQDADRRFHEALQTLEGHLEHEHMEAVRKAQLDEHLTQKIRTLRDLSTALQQRALNLHKEEGVALAH
ncbi:hypothetical protein J4464_05170 [Candidatus Woesearchaeota archaeon]|nr:hypothetical protein [Candidatus Woesearchaeota archaeon]